MHKHIHISLKDTYIHTHIHTLACTALSFELFNGDALSIPFLGDHQNERRPDLSGRIGRLFSILLHYSSVIYMYVCIYMYEWTILTTPSLSSTSSKISSSISSWSAISAVYVCMYECMYVCVCADCLSYVYLLSSSSMLSPSSSDNTSSVDWISIK